MLPAAGALAEHEKSWEKGREGGRELKTSWMGRAMRTYRRARAEEREEEDILG
jgi:hypothetical protein